LPFDCVHAHSRFLHFGDLPAPIRTSYTALRGDSTLGRLHAALMAGGPTAVCRHATAASIWGLISLLPTLVEVTVTRGG
jgi:hypothetical protein